MICFFVYNKDKGKSILDTILLNKEISNRCVISINILKKEKERKEKIRLITDKIHIENK